MLALALAVAGLGLGCTGRKAKCEKARESWAADNRAATAGALEFASEKDRPVIEEAAKKEIAAGEKAYVHLCLKRSDTDIDCLAKGPKMKVDPGCAAAVQKMEADLRAATELSAAAPEAPPTQPEAAAPVPEVNIETLDWSSVPRWTWSLQRSANIARRKTISVDECPEAKALEAMPVVDEFEKNDRAAKVEQLQQICLEARKQMAEKIPHLAVLALPVFRGGEFDFKASQFPMLLPNTTASFSAAAKKAHSTFDAQSEGLWNAYLVDNVGDTVVASADADIKPGNHMPLKNIPVGTQIHNIELKPGHGGQMVRSAGSSAQLMAREGAMAQVRLPSGETRMVMADCMATIGQGGNAEHELIQLGKAGRKRWLGKRSHQRGVSMNPIDHPHGGGEGRTSGGRHPVTPWGKPTKGHKTRHNKRTDNLIVRRRNAKG